MIEGGLTWQSALLVFKNGRKVALVGSYDAPPLVESGDWDEVIPYIQSIREPLQKTLEQHIPADAAPKMALNYSESDDKSDGLTCGMRLVLERHLAGTRFSESFVSAEPITRALRGRKTDSEIRRIQAAIAETERLFEELAALARPGITERALYDFVHEKMAARQLTAAWEASGCPIVNCGPDSPVGHTLPSETRQLAPGHLLHVDLGVVKEGYASDLQRCWFVGQAVPDALKAACDAVVGAIGAGFAALRPGVPGWQVDAAARAFLVRQGYPEYLHALGHQVGRVAHDGGGILAPRWERYGASPFFPVEEGQVYTLELGVPVEGYGYLSLEEMVQVTPVGARWLSQPQREVWLLPG